MESNALTVKIQHHTSISRVNNVKTVLKGSQCGSINVNEIVPSTLIQILNISQHNFISINSQQMSLLNTRSTHRKLQSSIQKMEASQVNLNAEILRLQANASMKKVQSIWHLNESEICDFFQNYSSLPMSNIKIPHLIGREGVRIVKNENKIYFGEVLYRKKHGKGVSIYRDGRIYEGHFFNNQKNGYGCQLYSNGNLYIGQFGQNKKHGKGSFYWFSLCSPACTKDSQYEIQQYHGLWWGGLPDGEGEHKKSNGDVYTGGFKNGLKHGDGVEIFANGGTYKGEYINGLAEGYGELINADGSKYKGDFKQGYKNGYGVWTSPNQKEEYKGHYLLDRKHGYGVYRDKNGRIYKGNYFQDARTGQGELYEDEELIYSGLWQNNKQLENYSSPSKNRKTIKSTLKTQKNQNNQSSNFRVKTSKAPFSSQRARNFSANTTKRNNFQVNFKHCEGQNLSTHRGCVACRKRPQAGQYSPNRNPEDV